MAALDPEEKNLRAKAGDHQPSTGPGITVVVDQTKDSTNESTTSVEPTAAAMIQEAYRETVMAVPHYEEEYGESINENLAAELRTSLAQILSASDAVTPQLQAAILTQDQQASSQRSDLFVHTETEYETLTDMRRRHRYLFETAEKLKMILTYVQSENLFSRGTALKLWQLTVRRYCASGKSIFRGSVEILLVRHLFH